MLKITVGFVLVLLIGCSSSPAVKPTSIEPDTQTRVKQWKSFIDSGSQCSSIKKLTSVNDVVNQFNFVDDIDH